MTSYCSTWIIQARRDESNTVLSVLRIFIEEQTGMIRPSIVSIRYLLIAQSR